MRTNIVYIHQYFRTPEEPGGTRSYWIATELIKAGHQVTMITSGKVNQQELMLRKNIDGINVIYIRNDYSQQFGIWRRLVSFIRFAFQTTRVLFKEGKTDLVIATSTPLTIGIPPLIFKKIKKVPYLFEVRDLWPEVPIQMGVLNNSLARKLAMALERVIYNNAHHIVALSPGMMDGVVKVTGQPAKVSMIPNMAKTDKFRRREKNDALRLELGLGRDTFKLIHFGAMGKANGLDYLIKTANWLKQNKVKDVEIIFLGGGSETEKIKNAVKEYQLDFVYFPGEFGMEKTSEIVNLCDASVVTFLNLPILATNSPNKLFDSLSAGIPVIVNSNGWTKTLVEENECGAYVNPEDPADLGQLIVQWKSNKPMLDKMGENANHLAETTYDKSILCRKFVSIVNTFNS